MNNKKLFNFILFGIKKNNWKKYIDYNNKHLKKSLINPMKLERTDNAKFDAKNIKLK